MHCKLDIERSIIKKAIEIGIGNSKTITKSTFNSLKVDNKNYPIKGQSFKVAEEVTKRINDSFGETVAIRNEVTNGQEIKINPSEALIDDYYDGYIKTEGKKEQAESSIDRFGDSKPLYNKETSITSQDKEIRSKFFSASQASNSMSILDKIAKSNHPLNKLAEKLKRFSKLNNVTIVLKPVKSFKMDSKNPNSEEANAFFDPKTNSIHIAEFANYTLDGSERVLLHEIIHSVTHSKLQDSSSVSKDFEKLYNQAVKELGKDNHYALSNVDEFIVGLFTDPGFINKLKNVQATNSTKYTNLFKEIFDYILSLLSIGKTNSLYEEAFSVASHVLNDYAEGVEAIKSSMEEDKLFSKAPKQEKTKPVFEKQYVFFKRRINKLKKELERIPKDSDEYTTKEYELKGFLDRFNKATEENDKQEYIAMANEYLDWVENLTKYLPENPDKYIISQLTDAFDILNSFSDFTGLKDRPNELREQLFPYIVKHNLKTINNFNTSGKIITEEDVDNQTKDVRWSASAFGSLSDVYHHIANTIASIIKAAQNRASTANKKLEGVIQKEVDKLSTYAKENNMILEEVYDILTQENEKGHLVLAQKYNKGQLNSNFEKITSEPVLRDFYFFYQQTLKEAERNLPYKVGKFYILNKQKSDVKSDLKKLIPVENILFDSFVSNEELLADIVPDQFRVNIPAEKKSKDLGSGLLEFAAYANNHSALSSALPEARLLQEQLKHKQNANGTITERDFIKSSSSKEKVEAENSNIYKMVKAVIDIQLKGKTKDSKMTPINLSKIHKKYQIKDSEGNIIGYKQVKIEDLIDRGLRWNSLLRIGLSPITAVTNVLFGDISNFMEAVGGKYFTVSDMHKATKIFFKQIDYTSKSNDSNVYKWLHRLNPLQELADYDLGENLQANPKKLTPEKALEKMYFMQKKGELYLQSRTMIAMLIHEGYMNSDGSNTSKEMTEAEAIAMSDKIQKINQQIHGRYSQREAATLSQSVWYRMAIQFRKWIPAAIEARFGDYKEHDNRLQSDSIGRYRTLGTYVGKELVHGNIVQAFENMFLPLLNSKKALEKGNMSATEIYNMRKNMTEMLLLLATVLSYAVLKGDDDDKEWKKRSVVKLGLTTLNRVSGDMLFFYKPTNVNNMMKNAVPMGKLITDILDVGYSLPHAFYMGDYKVKKGSLKNDNEFYSKDIPAIVPGLAPAAQIQRILSTDILPELN